MPGLEHIAQYAGTFFVSGIWQGFVLAAAVGLCLRLAPKTTATLRFVIWAVALLVIALLPFAAKLETGHTGQSMAASMFALDTRWGLAIAALWMAASFFRASDLAVHGWRLWSLRKRSKPVKVGQKCDDLLSSGPRRVELCTSMEIDRPSVIGFFAPRILIPAWLFEQLTASELEQIVLHEMEHLRRGDDWLNLLQKISLILFPLNPIVIWVERQLCFERELACDDGVLRRTKAPRAYASCLTNLAERGLNRRVGLLALGALGAAARESELARRVHRILRRETALSPIWTKALMGAIVLGLVGGAAGLARCPQIISFATPVRSLRAEMLQPLAPSAAPVITMTPDRVNTPVTAEQVAFKDSAPPHMTLLMATARRASTANRHMASKVHRSMPPVAEKAPVIRQVLTSAKPQHDSARSWVVLSSWTQNMRPQVIVPIVDYNAEGNTILLPYAAVPTADGWFIIQL